MKFINFTKSPNEHRFSFESFRTSNQKRFSDLYSVYICVSTLFFSFTIVYRASGLGSGDQGRSLAPKTFCPGASGGRLPLYPPAPLKVVALFSKGFLRTLAEPLFQNFRRFQISTFNSSFDWSPALFPLSLSLSLSPPPSHPLFLFKPSNSPNSSCSSPALQVTSGKFAQSASQTQIHFDDPRPLFGVAQSLKEEQTDRRPTDSPRVHSTNSIFEEFFIFNENLQSRIFSYFDDFILLANRPIHADSYSVYTM